MCTSGADVVPGGASYFGGDQLVASGSIAELTSAVVAPAPQCSVGSSCARIRITGADVFPGGAGDLGRGWFLFGGSVAELAVIVGAPAPHSVPSVLVAHVCDTLVLILFHVESTPTRTNTPECVENELLFWPAHHNIRLSLM